MANTKIPSELIADGSIVTAKIADDAVSADKLASSAVVTASIVDDAITSAKIVDNPTFSGTESITIPSGTTAQRASSPANGMVRYNTTESTVEGYISGQWRELQTAGYAYTLEYVVVAGGGAGGTGAYSDAAGGAGGGGYACRCFYAAGICRGFRPSNRRGRGKV